MVSWSHKLSTQTLQNANCFTVKICWIPLFHQIKTNILITQRQEGMKKQLVVERLL